MARRRASSSTSTTWRASASVSSPKRRSTRASAAPLSITKRTAPPSTRAHRPNTKISKTGTERATYEEGTDHRHHRSRRLVSRGALAEQRVRGDRHHSPLKLLQLRAPVDHLPGSARPL